MNNVEIANNILSIKYHKDEIAKRQHEINKLKEANKELEKPEPRLYKGQPVLVREQGISAWATRFFYALNNGSFVTTDEEYWDECKPDLTFKSIINWIEWKGGDCPVDGGVIVGVVLGDGGTRMREARLLSWGGHGGDGSIIRYAVIGLPEWVD